MLAGCSLSSSITGEDVRNLKKKHPGVPVVSYVNTSADVKAETDVCCTSANAVKIVNSLGVKKVIFLPDDYLAKYVASQTNIEIISWKGTCEVHEQFNDHEINEIRKNNPGIKIIAHPECPPDVIKASDFAGSTSGMIKYVKDNQPEKVMMVTECSMSDNVKIDNPKVQFIRPCNLCPHMKRITLPKVLDCLENETNEIVMSKETIQKAKKISRENGRNWRISPVSKVKLSKRFINKICKEALKEDLNPSGDITSKLLDNTKKIKAKLYQILMVSLEA